MGRTEIQLDQLVTWRVRIGLSRQFISAQTTLTERQVVLVRVEANGYRGWGEAAPVPGHTAEDIDSLWQGLEQLTSNHGLDSTRHSTGMIRAALNQAADDAAARQIGLPLWKSLGGKGLGGKGQIPASAAIGVDAQGRPDNTQRESAAASGYRHMKLKVTPDTDPGYVAALAGEYPAITFGVDANGSLGFEDISFLSALDGIGLEYIEQPGDPDDLEQHARLRRQLETPISLDESAHSSHAIADIVTLEAADIVNLKVGRFGTAETLGIATDLAAHGIRARIGGLIETGIGRAHSVALASHPVFTVVGDIAGSERYFTNDLVVPQWRVKDGQLTPSPGPGIGVAVNETAIADLAIDSITVS